MRLRFAKRSALTRITGVRVFWRWGGNAWWVQIQGDKTFRPTKVFAFAKIIVFRTFLGLGVKFSRWGGGGQ